jgi:hypothetical protein
MTTTHFASEALPNNPGPALAIVIGAKNVVSFGASYGIVPMVHEYNYIVAFMIVSLFLVVARLKFTSHSCLACSQVSSCWVSRSTYSTPSGVRVWEERIARSFLGIHPALQSIGCA